MEFVRKAGLAEMEVFYFLFFRSSYSLFWVCVFFFLNCLCIVKYRYCGRWDRRVRYDTGNTWLFAATLRKESCSSDCVRL